jgi:hypothetical protein
VVARSVRGRVVRGARTIRRRSVIDVAGDLRGTVLLAGTGRSGTTWIGRVLAAERGCRFVFEPFNERAVARAGCFPDAEYVAPDISDPERLATAEGLLRGQVRSAWTERHNRAHLATRRVVKEIRVSNLLPWFHRAWPELRMVFLVRHPCAVAVSQIDADFDAVTGGEPPRERPVGTGAVFARFAAVIDDVFEHGDRFDRLVLRWCMENRLPLSMSRDALPLFTYERFVTDAEPELARLEAASGLTIGARARVELRAMQGYARRPATKEAIRQARADGWVDAVDAGQRARADEILQAFGLDELYGAEEVLPRAGADLRLDA